jgi:serine kinase of HPr protein (carbohydrate metabolism regulator)
MRAARNHHATGLVIGTRGFLFFGPSGSGKTSLALTVLAQAEARGHYAAIIGDDQVLLSKEGALIVAQSIPSIAGVAEIRGSDIVTVAHISSAVIDFAVMAFENYGADRLPPEGENFDIEGIGSLPLLRLAHNSAEAFSTLTWLADQREIGF